MSDVSSISSRVIERLEELASQYAELSARLQDPETLSDHNAVRDLSIKRAAIEPVVTEYNRFCAIEAEADELQDAIDADEDPELIELAREEIPRLTKQAALAAALTPPVDEAGYHPAYDRGLVIGANNWNRAGPDGSINIVDDILGVAQQFGHSCE